MLTDLPLAAVRYAALLNTAMHRVAPESRRMVDWDRSATGVYEQVGFDYLPWLVQWPHEKAICAFAEPEDRLAEMHAQGYRTDFGSADDIAQVLAHYPDLEASEVPYLLTYRTLTRQSDPGWRWHKQGPYLGVRKPQCEHLGEEPEIDTVITWEIWEVLPVVDDLGGHLREDLRTWLRVRMAGQRRPWVAVQR